MITITTLLDNAVLQRNAQNLSDHPIEGKADSSGSLRLTVFDVNGSILKNFDSVAVGCSEKGRIHGRIAGLTTGGPYTLFFKIADSQESLTIANVLVGDLWILAGQSNMQGYGFMPSLSEQHPLVRAFYMTNTWDIAADPLHDLEHAVAPVHGGNPAAPYPKKLLRGSGPGLPFAIAMYKATGVPQGLIACAHGGTTLEQWDPALKKLGGHSLFGAACERIKMLGGKTAGLLWYQGCSDTHTDQNVAAYTARTRRLFNAFRRECSDTQLPIVLVQLAAFTPLLSAPAYEAHQWLKVRNQQYLLGKSLKNCACVPAIDLELDDKIHISNRAVLILGQRLAQAMQALKQGNQAELPIELERITVGEEKASGCVKYQVTFKNVIGQLTAPALPAGFSLVDKNGKLLCEALRIRVNGNQVEAVMPISLLEARTVYNDSYLAYGALLQPHCNITDSGNRSLPCFMSKLNYNRTKSRFLRNALVSNGLYGGETLESLHYPTAAELSDMQFQPIKFFMFYLTYPRSANEDPARCKVYYYKFKMQVPAAGDFVLYMGADAPFALYMNGEEIMRKQTSNPIIPDEFAQPLTLSAGEYEFVCALSSNYGKGDGICARIWSKNASCIADFKEITTDNQ